MLPVRGYNAVLMVQVVLLLATQNILTDSVGKDFVSRESSVLLTSVIFIDSIISPACALFSSIGYGHNKPC